MPLIIFSIGAGFALFIYWMFWLLWCWAVPQLWPTGPASLVSPGFWLFVAIAILLSFVGRLLFGSRKNA